MGIEKMRTLTRLLLCVLSLSGCKEFLGDDWGRDRYPCEDDDDCQDELLCGEHGYCGYPCDTDTNVGCDSSSECVDGNVCQPSDCKSNDDCGNLALCNADLGLCAQLPCDENTGECPSILTCDERWMECTPKTCQNDGDCDQVGADCDVGNGVCYLIDFPDEPVSCTVIGEAENNGCSKTQGHLQCVDFAFKETDGDSHLYCTHYCESDFDCGDGSVCMVGFGPVSSVQNGVNTFCGSLTFMTNGVGKLCSDNGDCAEGLECLSVHVLGTTDSRTVCTATNCDESPGSCPAGWLCCMTDSAVEACNINPTETDSCQ